MDHYKNPRNWGKIKQATIRAEEGNSSCGDRLEMSLVIKKNKIEEIGFEGEGCAISVAAASMLTEAVKGKKINKVIIMGKEEVMKLLKIKISGARMKCATLGLVTLKKAIKEYEKKARS